MDLNPYKPPVGNVDEPEVRRPWQIRVALALFGVALACNIPHVIYRFAREPAGMITPVEQYFGLALALAIMLGLAGLIFYGILKGRRWGRVLYVMVVLLGAIYAFTVIPVWFRRSAYLGASDLLSTLADIAALALLFTPAANAFFRKE